MQPDSRPTAEAGRDSATAVPWVENRTLAITHPVNEHSIYVYAAYCD
jgi:hypothetical protein